MPWRHVDRKPEPDWEGQLIGCLEYNMTVGRVARVGCPILLRWDKILKQLIGSGGPPGETTKATADQLAMDTAYHP